MFQNKKLKCNTTFAIAEVAEVALCALATSENKWLNREEKIHADWIN